MRRAILLLALLLSACGGGGSAGYGPVGWQCNSAESGDWLNNGVVEHSSPTPIRRLNTIGSVVNIDHCVNGQQLHELLSGGPVAFGTIPGEQVESLAAQLAHDPETVVVIGVGEVEPIFTTETPAEHYNELVEAVREVRAAGKTPQIAGLIRFAQNGVVSADAMARVEQFDQLRRDFAKALNLTFYDLHSVRFLGAADQRPDGLHPGPDYQQRLMEYAASVQSAARVPAY